MRPMMLSELSALPWFQELRVEVERCCAERLAQSPVTVEFLQQQLSRIDEQCRGWSFSLSNPQLPAAVRADLEQHWEQAAKERESIQHQISDIEQMSMLGVRSVDQKAILDRLNRLEEVLQENCPSRGNIELSGYIDSISCHPTGKVDLRIFKYGAMDRYDPETLMLLEALESCSSKQADRQPCSKEEEGITEHSDNANLASTPSPPHLVPTKPQIRKKRRFTPLSGEDLLDTSERSEALMEPDRFAMFGPEFFWTDSFHLPFKRRWHEEHAHEVAALKAQKKTYDQMTEQLGKSKPILLEALRFAKLNPLP